MPPRYFTCKKIERDHVKTFYLHIVSKVCTWANSERVRRGKARRATGITAFIMSFLQKIKIVVTLMTRLDWRQQGNESQASQLSRLKDKNQLWIHCDERAESGCR